MRKKNILIIIIVMMTVIFSITSCKRSKVQDPDVIPNAGFRIVLSGTANNSTLYVPETMPEVTSIINVRALNSDGTPAANYDVIFREGLYGYFDDFRNSVVKTTGADGRAQAIFKIPPSVGIKSEVMTNVIVTLVDNGRLDNNLSRVEDAIPIRLIPYITQGIMIHGRVTTPAGNGVEGVTIQLLGDVGLASGVTLTRPSGSYEFYVAAGWYGTIAPDSPSYSFVPNEYEFDVGTPVTQDLYDVDFVATFEGGETIDVDVRQWVVPMEGGTQLVNVYNGTGDASLSYIVMPDSNWIHVSPNSGTTPGSFTITIDENASGEERDGSVTVTAVNTEASSVTIDITQQSGDVSSDSRLAVDRETVNLEWDTAPGAADVTLNVYNSTTNDSISFLVTSNNNWLSPSLTSGTTPNTLGIDADPNFGAARTGQVILTPTSIGVSNTVTVTINQDAGPSLAIDITERNSPVNQDVFTVNVINPTTGEAMPFKITASATNPTGMLGAGSIQPTQGNTPAAITIVINPNATGQLRTAEIYFTGNYPNITAAYQPSITLTITQQGS
jgi:hypothetical protein